MSKLISGLFAGAVAVVVMSHSEPAAASSTWNLQTACNPAPVQGAYTLGGNTVTCSTGVPSETMTATAWSNIGSGGTFLRASMGDFTGGIGAYSGSNESGYDSQHAFDNISTSCRTSGGTQKSSGCGGSQEFMLINFGPYKVDLDALSIGYRSGDADVAVLRWDGADKADTEMNAIVAGLTTGTLTTTGWSLVATESLDSTPDTTSVDFGGKVSSWWIVSTYYGTTASSTAGNLNTGNDKFKLSALTATVCTTGVYNGGTQGNGGTCGSTPPRPGVPEPGSLALAGLALAGVFASRRKIKASI